MNDNTRQDSSLAIHVEGNFAEWPFFNFSRRNANKKIMRYEFYAKDKNGAKKKRAIEVTNAKYQIPGELEYNVFIWLLKKTYDEKFPEKLHFTIGEIVRDLKRFRRSGRNHSQVKNALKRLNYTSIYFLNSFYREGEYCSIENFRIFSSFKYWEPEHEEEGVSKRQAREKTYITWAPEFLENLKKDYYKIIDWNFFMSLKKGLEKRLYVLLEKKMGRKGEFWIDWEKLADLVPITSKDRYMKKKYLSQSINTLAIKGFLIYSENEKGVLHFTRVHRPTAEEGNRGDLYAILERLKISSNQAQKKCVELSTEALERYTAWIVWYFLEKDIRKEPEELFFKGIKDGWSPPDEFLLGWYKYVWPQIKSKILEDKKWIENYAKEKIKMETEEAEKKDKRKDSKPELIGNLINQQTLSKRMRNEE